MVPDSKSWALMSQWWIRFSVPIPQWTRWEGWRGETACTKTDSSETACWVCGTTSSSVFGGMESADAQRAWEEGRPRRCYRVYSYEFSQSAMILRACILNLDKCIHSGFPSLSIKGNVFKSHLCCHDNNLSHDVCRYFMVFCSVYVSTEFYLPVFPGTDMETVFSIPSFHLLQRRKYSNKHPHACALMNTLCI